MTVDYYIVEGTRQDVIDGVNDPACFSEYRQGKITSLKPFASKCLAAAAGIATDEGLRLFGIRERDVQYVLNDHGKPEIAGHPEIIFNISHSGEYAVAAFLHDINSDAAYLYDIGVDIERISRVKKGIVSFMKNDAGFADEPRDLCRRWTVREAFVKCIGTGLSSIREDYYLEKSENGDIKLCQDIYDGEFMILEPEAPEGYNISCVIRKRLGKG